MIKSTNYQSQMLSHIQNQILSNILKKQQLTYTECIPEGVDKDLFNYHFKFLKEKKYVKKNDDGTYSLTDFGKKYVQRMDVLGNMKEFFKVSVLPYVTRDFEGATQILTHRRKRHPYFNDIASVSGKVLHTELITDAASRKLEEETGLLSNDFKLFGVHRKIRFDKNNNLIEDTLYHCTHSHNPGGELKELTEFGENKWINFNDFKNEMKSNVTFHERDIEVIERIENNNFELFYFEDEMTLESY